MLFAWINLLMDLLQMCQIVAVTRYIPGGK
jgi:hypothetical protein